MALHWTALVSRLRSQLGLGHRYSDVFHYAVAVAAAHLPDEVSFKDAEAAAGNEGYPGEIQEVQHARSAQAGPAEGNGPAVQRARCESGEWVFPAAGPDAFLHRLLQNAECSH